MIIKTKEIAKHIYDIIYYVDETKMPKELIIKLKEMQKEKDTNYEDYIKFIEKIILRYDGVVKQSFQHKEGFGFEICNVKDIKEE